MERTVLSVPPSAMRDKPHHVAASRSPSSLAGGAGAPRAVFTCWVPQNLPSQRPGSRVLKLL